MRKTLQTLLSSGCALLLIAAMSACAGGGAAAGPATASEGAPAADASGFAKDGFSISRIDGWSFVPADQSVGPDTVVIMQGPIGTETLAPAVEVSRRALSAADQRRRASHVLTQLVTEMVQVFDGFEMDGSPADMELSGKPAARIGMKYTESLPDGATVKRRGQFYGVVSGGNIWIIRCVGPEDGSLDDQFKRIVDSVAIES